MVNSFLDLLYSNILRREGCDRMRQKLNRNGRFNVRSYYAAMQGTGEVSFPWKSIWCIKASKMGFFLCMDNSMGEDYHVREDLL